MCYYFLHVSLPHRDWYFGNRSKSYTCSNSLADPFPGRILLQARRKCVSKLVHARVTRLSILVQHVGMDGHNSGDGGVWLNKARIMRSLLGRNLGSGPLIEEQLDTRPEEYGMVILRYINVKQDAFIVADFAEQTYPVEWGIVTDQLDKTKMPSGSSGYNDV
ncbi:hypothetical protein EDD18DRAFT_1112471 [Armillaria luteobubalina]|uniref:Uncharacterized protein n=1 Tax=Armillaria luteobubalina TaxID=153913 RepID=A0AA39UKQ8_9AGAR|nr:hypothetical protein EDD18DRAFT_1112471 [Armillaria luteobubalina]